LALVACTSGDGPRPSESSSPSAFHPPTPPLSTVEPGDLRGVGSVPWSSATLVDERTLDLRYLGAPNRCRVLANVRVKESATEVTITVYLGTPPDHADETCTNLGLPARTRVPLTSPLGARRVLDGGTNPAEERTVSKP
jgi:hypothetical protein